MSKWWTCKFDEPKDFDMGKFMGMINCKSSNNVNSCLAIYGDKCVVTCPNYDILNNAMVKTVSNFNIEYLGEE